MSTPRGRFGVVSAGAGPPVVLLHSLAMSGRMWAEGVARLGDRFTVWAVDARGHGESSWDGAPFGVEDLAEDLAAVYDAVGLDRPHLVGLSMGGSVALVFAARHPERVGGLVLSDTTACYGEDRVSQWEERAVQAETSPREQLIPFQLDRWLTPGFAAARPDVVRLLTDVFVSTSAQVHAAACRALGALDAESLLARITSPSLVLVGADDYATPPAMARTIASGVADARLDVLSRLRHMSLIEDETLWASISEHLARSAASRAAAPIVDG